MKLYTTLLLAVAAGLAVYLARRRIRLALTVGAVAYAILLPLRLLFSAGDLVDRLDEFLLPGLGVATIWVILWWISTRYARRKRARPPTSRPTAFRHR